MSYTITWEQELGEAGFAKVNDPLSAAKECLSEIQNGEALAFTVIDNTTGKKFSVDLSEPDENAVLEINS